MNLKKLGLAFVVACAAGIFGSGCAHDPDILDQQAAAKKMGRPSAEVMKKGFAEVAANHDKGKQEEIAWAAAHPDKVAQVNADRASAGRPPLGQ